MKIQIFFKTPDAVNYALEELEFNKATEIEVRNAIEKWIEYDEDVTIEIDTKTNKAIVLPV